MTAIFALLGVAFDSFDALEVSANGQRLVWKKPPAIITDDNAVILVHTDDDALRRHISDAFNLVEHGNHSGASRDST